MSRSRNGHCDYVCKGESEEEIMKNAEQPAMRHHGYKTEDLMTPELREKIRLILRDLNSIILFEEL